MGLGLTLSRGQVEACPGRAERGHHGLSGSHPGAFGTFDAVASLGAFEHFCS